MQDLGGLNVYYLAGYQITVQKDQSMSPMGNNLQWDLDLTTCVPGAFHF